MQCNGYRGHFLAKRACADDFLATRVAGFIVNVSNIPISRDKARTPKARGTPKDQAHEGTVAYPEDRADQEDRYAVCLVRSSLPLAASLELYEY